MNDNVLHDFDAQFDRAVAAAALAEATEPRAIAALYDATESLVVIKLNSGAIFSFPPQIAQGLAGASVEDLAQIEVTPAGDGLHWERLNADLSVPELLVGIFGTQAWMQQMQQMGLSRSA
jgi:Protein of unknown function (DUF2442)